MSKASTFVREDVTTHLYRGDFYNPMVGHLYESYTGDFHTFEKQNPNDFSWFHFGKLVEPAKLLSPSVLYNEDGASLRIASTLSARKQKQLLNKVKANMDRPVLVLMHNDLNGRYANQYYDIQHDPKSLTTARHGSMGKPDDNTVAAKVGDHLGVDVDWDFLEKKIGADKVNSLIEEAEDHMLDGIWDETEKTKWLRKVQVYMRQARFGLSEKTRKLVAKAKRDRSAHNAGEIPYEWKDAGKLIDTRMSVSRIDQTTGKGKSAFIHIKTSTIESGFTLRNYTNDDLKEVKSKLDRLEDQPILICVRKVKNGSDFDEEIIDIAPKRNALRSADNAITRLDTKYHATQKAIREEQELITTAKKQILESEKRLRKENERKRAIIERELTQLLNAKEKAEALFNDKAQELHDEQDMSKQITADVHDKLNMFEHKSVELDEKHNSIIPQLFENRSTEIEKIIALQDFMKESMESKKKTITTYDRSRGARSGSLIRIPVKSQPSRQAVKEAESEGVTYDEVKQEPNTGDAEYWREQAMTAQLQLKDKEKADLAFQLLMRDYRDTRNYWSDLSEEKYEALMDQFADMEQQRWTEKEMAEFYERAEKFRQDAADLIDKRIRINILSRHSRVTLALRSGLELKGKVSITMLKMLGGKNSNKYRVELPDYSVDIVACLDYDKRDPGQIGAISWLHHEGKKWQNIEEQVTGFQGKWRDDLPIKQYLDWHTEIKNKLMLL